MSYQKKSLILQQLEQAIRKKAQQKSRNKEQMNRVLQGSIEKKKNVLKTANNKDVRVSSIHKNSDTASKQNLADKPVSIFNNEHLNVFDSSEFKAKKYNNRKLDKLVSLIQYMVSSSEKALRYISSTNFQAEFALKLYRSDRENLVNELKNLNFDDIIDSQRTTEKGVKPDQAYNMLLQQNNKLKKEILILEKEAENYHNKVKDNGSFESKQHEKEINKLRQMLRKLMPFEGFKQIIEMLQKQSKFQVMAMKSQQNSKKTTEIQIVLSSLENERQNIIEGLTKFGKQGKTDRVYRLNEIQGEKQQLQRQLAQMKVKLAEIIDSGKSINQLELLKKNSEFITQKLATLYKELSPNSMGKKNNEQIVEYIRTVCLNLQQKNFQLTQSINNLSQQNDSLREDVDRLKEQKKELENDARSEGDEVRMENMLSQIQKLRDIVDQLGQGQEISSRRILELEQRLKIKQEETSELTSQLRETFEKANEFKSIINELNDEIVQVQNQFNRTLNQNTTLHEKLRITQNDIISNGYSKQELKAIQTEKDSLSKKLEAANNRNNYLEQQIRQLESQIIEKDDQLQQLSNKMSKQITGIKNSQIKTQQASRQLNFLKQQLQFTKAQKVSVQKMMEQQRQRHISDHENLNSRLQGAQILNIKISQQKVEAVQKLEVQRENIQSLKNKVESLEQEINELQEEIKSLTIKSSQALCQKEHSRDLLSHIEEEKETLKSELTSAKQQMQDHSEIIRFKNKQYVNLLRQILKGLLIDPSEYADKSTFEELLEFGSQQVVQIRKRQRQQQSNKRKNSKRDYDNILSQFNDHEQNLEECKVRLFQQPSVPTFEKKQSKQDLIDLDEFNQLKEQPNNSMISAESRDHQEQANLSQFNDQEMQDMGESMISNDFVEEIPEKLSLNSAKNMKEQPRLDEQQDGSNKQINELPERISLNSVHNSLEQKKLSDSVTQNNLIAQLPEKLSLNSIHNSQEDKKHKIIDNLQENQLKYNFTTSQIQQRIPNISQFNEIQQNVSESMISEQPIEIKVSAQKHHKHENQQDLLQFENNSNFLDDQGHQQLVQEGMDNNSMFFNNQLNLLGLLTDSSKLKPKPNRGQQGYSKHTLLSIAIKDQKLDLDQFEQVKSMEGNQSFVSSNQNMDSHRGYVFTKQEQDEMGELDVKVMPLNLSQFGNQEEGMNFSEFNEMNAEGLGESMISHKEEDHNIDQFGEMGDHGLSQSMISIKENSKIISAQEEHELQKKHEELEIEQFGQVDNQMNNSMLSEKQSQHGLSEFGELSEERMNESLISEKHQKQEEGEHGMSEFGEIQDNGMNDSLLSQNYNLKDSNNSAQNAEKKNNFDEFQQYKQQKMSQSMISQKQGVISRLKSDESFESP